MARDCCEFICGAPTTFQGYGIEQNRIEWSKSLNNRICRYTFITSTVSILHWYDENRCVMKLSYLENGLCCVQSGVFLTTFAFLYLLSLTICERVGKMQGRSTLCINVSSDPIMILLTMLTFRFLGRKFPFDLFGNLFFLNISKPCTLRF